MVYCINPNCTQRQIDGTAIDCPGCQTPLRINNKYYLLKPLRALERGHPYAEIFEVQDVNDYGTKVLKVLIKDFTQLVNLFQQEASLLIDLKHPGIPKAEEQFSLSLSNGNKLHCLVMEKIEGQNLEQWVEQNGTIPEKQAIDWLHQIANILDYVHKKQLFHRDIKPSNIMSKSNGELVLIDFGTARKITETVVNGQNVTVVYSDGYTASEQIEGRAVPQSDFFALGRTFVYLLTGKHPSNFKINDKTGKLIWEHSTSQVSGSLTDLINQLMEPSWQKRPRDTKAILQCLKEIEKPNYRLLLLKGTLVGAVGLITGVGIYGSYLYLSEVGGCSKIWFSSFPKSDSLSCGEELLIPRSVLPEEQKGVHEFASGDYTAAGAWLEKAWQQLQDPEILIYLNNARLMRKKAYTIALVAPISSNRDTALEIMRGVAMAQNEINQGNKINGKGLKVLIADDANNPAQAKHIAEKLVAQADILAVVGHFSSDATRTAAEVYRQHQLVMISPTSTSESLSIFRTVPSDRISAQALASYLIKNVQQQKVAVFFNPQSNYSKSLREQFSQSFVASGGQVVKEFDLSTPLFKASTAINQAKKQGATALVLLPDSQTSSNAFRNSLKLIKANQGRYWMMGGDSFYNPELLQLAGKEAVNRLVVAIPWHSLSSPNLEFRDSAQKLWGGQVSWRTALTYDATRALIRALEKQPQQNRMGVQQALADPLFEVKGATGMIHFSPKGDRLESNIQLVNVVPSSGSDYEYQFSPVNSFTDQAGVGKQVLQPRQVRSP